MNKHKLANLIKDKRLQMGLTQEGFAQWFSQQTGVTISYGGIQNWESVSKRTVPEWESMKAIASVFNVSLNELDIYLENDEIKDLNEISSYIADNKDQIKQNPEMVLNLISESLNTEEKLLIFDGLYRDLVHNIKELSNLRDLLSQLKTS